MKSSHSRCPHSPVRQVGLKVEQIQPALKLAAMNPDWMQKHLRQHPDALAHRVVSDGNIVLAASTGELQEFVLAHLSDKDFFGGTMEMKRKQSKH